MDGPLHTRKRSSAWIDQDNNENVSLAYTPVNLTDLPSKRLQNSHGAPIHAKPTLKYDAQKLLSNLAFTRFYVTANFQNFNPATSYIILCMVSEQNELYHALCHTLPTLYTTSPSLQALAITAGYLNPNSTSDKTLQRMLPLTTTACVDSTIVDSFETFRRELGQPGGCLAVISPEGTCVWSSAEAGIDGVVDEADVVSLRERLVEVLGGGDVVMDEG